MLCQYKIQPNLEWKTKLKDASVTLPILKIDLVVLHQV